MFYHNVLTFIGSFNITPEFSLSCFFQIDDFFFYICRFTMAFVYYGVVLLTTELFAQGHSCAGKGNPKETSRIASDFCPSF